MINIRHATESDLQIAKGIYEQGRIFMRKTGNMKQWNNGYPQDNVIISDIEAGNLYICEYNSQPVGVFAFILGGDPTYSVIEGGSWSSDKEYGTVHRIASDGTTGGITKACFDYCGKIIPYLRVDTHEDNKPMQAAVTRYGFTYRGIIYIADGTKRLAYDCMISD